MENYCENPAAAPVPGGGGGLGADGGMAAFMLVPAARHLVPLPGGLDPVRAAPLTDAALTPTTPSGAPGEAGPGSTAVVIGAGGPHDLGIQILKATTAARMIATDTRTEALHCAGTAAPTWPSPPTRQPGSGSATPPAGATPTSCSTSPDPLALTPWPWFSVPYEASVQTT
jgi:propanol-preferring alcohol dehydrogenase